MGKRTLGVTVATQTSTAGKTVEDCSPMLLPDTKNSDDGHQGPDFAKVSVLHCCDFQCTKLKNDNSCTYLLGHQEEIY